MNDKPTVRPLRSAWGGEMTSRERFVNQMNHLPIDRSFNMPSWFWAENYREWGIFVDNGITCDREIVEFLGFDRYEIVYGSTWIDPPFEEEIIEESEGKRTIRNRDGMIAQVPADGHTTIPHFKESPIKNPEDWWRFKNERVNREHPGRIVDPESIRRQHPPDRDYPLRVDCGSLMGRIRDTLTLEGLVYAIHDYPDMVEDMVETACQLVEHFLDQVLGKIDFDAATGWEDICCRNGPLVPMWFFRDVVLPRYKRIGQRLHAAGIEIWDTDCDGDIRPWIPHFLEVGLNATYPFEVNSCGHPGEVLDRYGAEFRIIGGVDKLALKRGRDSIKEYLASLVPWVEKGGFIPMLDHACPPDIPEDDYLYYLDLKERMFGIPRALSSE